MRTYFIEDLIGRVATLAIGIGIGFYSAVILKVVDPGAEIARTYFGIITVFVGGSLGFLVGRLADRITDKRKRRRQAFINILKIQAMLNALEDLEAAAHISGARRGLGEVEPESYYSAVAIRARAIVDAPPNFDEVIDTLEDFNHAAAVLRAFAFGKWVTDEQISKSASGDGRYNIAESYLSHGGGSIVGGHRLRLQQAVFHFNKLIAPWHQPPPFRGVTSADEE